jgi:allophanate hydrolase
MIQMSAYLSIRSLNKAYDTGTLSPRNLLEQLVEQIEAVDNPNIWIYRLSTEELEPYLAKLEAADPKSLPLYGVPFAIKDNIDLAGVPTTAACAAYAYTPKVSCPVVEKLIRAGAVPLGKTNLDQFATGLVGVRSPYGAPRNPYAPDRVPGGSSSGSAVALAEGLVSFSLGTDTAGSGRVPAGFNGLWGLKPSRGRLSTNGLVPACRTLDCISVFALNGEDGQSVLRIVEGYDEEDAFSQATRDRPLPRSNRIGIPKNEQFLFFGDAGYEAAWKAAVEELKAKGWEIVEIDFEPFLEAARLLYEGPWVAERTAALEGFLESHPEDFFPVTKSIIDGGHDKTAVEAFAATYKLAELKRASEAAWEGIAAIVTPTAGGFPTLAELEADPIGRNSQLGYYTNFMNLLDLCAVATPAGETDSGLPFGITWIAPRDTDRALINLAISGTSEGGRLSPEAGQHEGCAVPATPAAGDSRPPEGQKGGRLSSNAATDRISLLLFGAHMKGLPLNPQVLGLGATFVAEVQTAEKYKMIYLPEPEPHRPGILRVDEGGVSIGAEEWSFPKAVLGDFLATIRQPLGLGEIELSDGRKVHGFICEAAIAYLARDISESGGWRNYLCHAASKNC